MAADNSSRLVDKQTINIQHDEDEPLRQDEQPITLCEEENSHARWKMYNVVMLGFAFMLMFTSFQTLGNIEETVLESVHNETNGTFGGSGYTSLSIIYAVFGMANWAAPSIIAVAGPKWSMIFGGICYCLFTASFLKPFGATLYAGSVLLGIGAAVIWTGQGTFLTINSDGGNMGRNSGIFWAMLQCSLLFGNMYVYFAFGDVPEVAADTRIEVFSVLSVISVLGLLALLLLRSNLPQRSSDITSERTPGSEHKTTSLEALKQSFRLLLTKEMAFLSVTFAYTGLELTYFSGVYGTMVGHTLEKRYIGLCGISVGIGEIMGGLLFGLMGKRTSTYGRDPIVLLGFLTHMVAFYLSFLCFPADSPIHESTDQATYITLSLYLALIIAFLLGFGDSSFNTQIYSLLGFLYSENSAPAFAMLKFFQSLFAAAAFFYSNVLQLQWQLLVLVVSAVASSMCFFLVEWRTGQQDSTNGYSRI